MYSLKYHRASSLDEAKSLLSQSEDPKIVAGGQTLIPTLKQRLASPSDLIDIANLPDFAGITVNGDTVSIKAGTKHFTVATSEDVKTKIPALAHLAGLIGDPHVRHMGTIGGSLANNDPSADYPAAVLGLNATVHTTDRQIAADDYFQGMFETALAEDEIITQVDFPSAEKAAYMKFPNPASRYAMVGVFVAKTSGGVRVAVTGAGSCVFRVPEMEQALSANFAPDAVASIKVPADDLNSDIHGSAEYRAHLVTVMAKRAVAAAIS